MFKKVGSLNNLVRKDKEINSDDCKYDLARRLKNKIVAKKPIRKVC